MNLFKTAKRKKQKPSKRPKRPQRVRSDRIKMAKICLTIAGVVLLIQLINLTIVDSTAQYAKQVDQLVDEVPLKASRGNILDRNGNVLVQDSTASAVHVIPYSVKEADRVAGILAEKLQLNYDEVYAKITQIENEIIEIKRNVSEKTANQLMAVIPKGINYIDGTLYATPSEIENPEQAAGEIQKALEMDYDTALEIVTRKKSNMVLVSGKVDNTLAKEIQEECKSTDEDGAEISNGVKLVEDKRRYYTNGNFASYVLGFTGKDHNGLTGIESVYDDVLKGEDGIVHYQKDAKGNQIPSQTKIIKEPEAGEDVTLTLDSNIQILAEKALNEAITQWKAKSGTVLVMDTKTGEVVSMATKPDYNLNDPYTLDENYAAKHAADLEGKSEDEQVAEMWKNPAVSFIYEPGSTFKAITASTGLEEGVVTPETKVHCSGSINVGGVSIGCTGVHGTQTVSEAVANSCNPGMVQIIQKLDPNLFYQYAYNYGFGDRTGIEMTGEEQGIVNRAFDQDGDINMLDYSTFSFGQGIGTTPIQMVSALNAVVNNGYYMNPTLIRDDADGSNNPKQLISGDTSAEMRKIMEKVVTESSNLAKQSEGYSIGGKTGTAEKFIDGEYSKQFFVTSFFCYAPVDDPRYSILMVLDEPDPSAYGGTSAAPYAIELMKQILNYAGGQTDASTEIKQGSITMPDVIGQDVEFAKKILDEKGITYRIENEGAGSKITGQSIAAQSVYEQGTELVLVTGNEVPESNGKVTVPDLTGMSIQSANEMLLGLDLRLEIEGSGFVVSQEPAAGTTVEAGSTVKVKFSP